MSSANDAETSKVLHHTGEKPPAVIGDCIIAFRQKGLSILSDMSKDEQTVFVNWAQNIVDRYGSLLQQNTSRIKNVADLPGSKENIKIAIKVLLPAYLAKGSDDVVDLLKDRYAGLGAFQEISPEDQKTILEISDEIDQESESADSSFFSTYQKYMQITLSEQKILLDDINAYINDLKIRKTDFQDQTSP